MFVLVPSQDLDFYCSYFCIQDFFKGLPEEMAHVVVAVGCDCTDISEDIELEV
jgi:hypothetical protein